MIKTAVIGPEEITVSYDDTQFEVMTEFDGEYNYLRWIGEGAPVNPKGNTYCDGMFNEYNGEHIDLSKFDVSNVVSMFGMFAHCPKLKSISMPEGNYRSLETISDMIYDCPRLTRVDMGGIDIRRIDEDDIGSIFEDCGRLHTVLVKHGTVRHWNEYLEGLDGYAVAALR